MRILNVQSSADLANSATREISKHFIQALKAKHPDATVVERDTLKHPVEMISPEVLGALYTPADKQTSGHKSLLTHHDAAVEELLQADVIVIGAPMYNFSIPAALKAWVDAVVRNGKTFKYTDKGPQGLVSSNKKVVIACASGGKYSDGPNKAMDFVEPYLKGILGFMGLTHCTVIRAEGLAFGPEAATAAKTKAFAAAKALAASF